MKLACSSIFNSNFGFGFSRVFRVFFSSTSEDTLFKRISPAGDPRVSIVPVLDKWIEEGRTVNREDLQTMIKQMRAYGRFTHALEISHWMSDRRYFNLSPGDIAVRLDLISKVHGVEQAEKYFSNIPEQVKAFQVYGALLNCYANKKSVEKAEAIMQKMRELGFIKRTLPYNVLLNLYSQMGKQEKLDALLQEMEEKGICYDKFTFNIRISAYAAASDVEGLEKIIKRMEVDPQVILDWTTYAVVANAYIKAGLVDKALAMLKKSEELVTVKRRSAYNFFLTLYAGTGKKDELYRVWNLIKTTEKVYNTTYICMISSLVKLDDINGAEKILEDWESDHTFYDFRVPNVLIAAYCKKGSIEKAEVLIKRAIGRGKKPNASTWNHLATGYLEGNQILKAVEMMKKAILASQPGWKPNRVTLAACLECLKGKGDVEGAEELVRLLRAHDSFPIDVHDRLLNYIKDGKPGSSALNQMKGDDLDSGGETHGILEFRQGE
ncbi:hypothetical protein HHK36_001882 [Tetracentron sinense]|uniref:Pentatricopeptide repeat-containing protein n=1 Tax=Tetracentron sinense TaxID=13715 RepID=A0A834ZYV0_TETSI|nr:hypothetical protein HHK36_001882 [Tetracentron sinense]